MGEYTEMVFTEVGIESRLNSSGLGYGPIQVYCKHRNEISGSTKSFDQLNHNWRLSKVFNERSSKK